MLIPKLYNTLYLRFKDIPPKERSGIYNNDGIKIGEELGVSCYKGVVIDNKVYIIQPHSSSKTYSILASQYESGLIPLYIITGKEVGKGSDNEPVLKDVKIYQKIIDWYL